MMKSSDFAECEENLKHEFQFFKNLSKNGIKIINMIEHRQFNRSLEVTTLCKEGQFTNRDAIYMVFQGQCEIYKTRNEFKIYDENGEEINQAAVDSPLKKPKDDVSINDN